jgi:hypothetical protein
LAGELIVSLTSYPPRFPTLLLTLACLSDQSVRADRIVLWIAKSDIGELPEDLRRKVQHIGVEIRSCDDIGPYKKLVPALQAFPDAYIVTADDDLYYPSDWLETLINGFAGSVTCLWGYAIQDGEINWSTLAKNGSEVLPGSGAGVLFSPGSLHPMVGDRRFLELCPTGDDLWYYWMAKLAGSSITKTGKFTPIQWVASQQDALWRINLTQNDVMAAALKTELPLSPAQ